METLTILIALGCGIVIGVMLDVLGMHATIKASKKKIDAKYAAFRSRLDAIDKQDAKNAELRKQIVSAQVQVRNAHWQAGFAAGIDAYPSLNADCRRNITEQWRVAEQTRRGRSVDASGMP